MDLTVRVDALAALAVQLGEVDDVPHRLRRRVELVEVRRLGMGAEADVDLAALRGVGRAPHRLLAVIAGKSVVLDHRLPFATEIDLLREGPGGNRRHRYQSQSFHG